MFRHGSTFLLILAGCALILSACEPVTEIDPEVRINRVAHARRVRLVNYDAAGQPVVRLDSEGNQMDAHGGEIRKFGDLYYWYAETYGCGFYWQKHSPSPFCGFRLFTSPNLTDWTDRGLLFDVSQWQPWQERCNWWTMGCFRPHVIYNEKTRKYVLWVNMYDVPVGYHVLVSDSPEGPFVEQPLPRLAFNDGPPGAVNNGDQNLFVDDDGTAYIVYAEWRVGGGDVVVERLTPDYLSGTGEFVRLGSHHSEAPSMFKRDGRYYVLMSSPPNWAYGKSATTYYTASSPLGRWSGRRQISATSCSGQAAHVARLPTSSGGSWYLFQIDLWLNSDGVDAGDGNQAPAPQFWAPLEFGDGGEILPIRCEPSFTVDTWTAAPPNPSPPVARIMCDIGAAKGGETVREYRLTAAAIGTLASIDLPVYQRGDPDAPLDFELRSATGALLKRVTVEPNGGNWDVPPTISWAARKLRVPLAVPVTAGQRVDLRLRSATRRGCYGFAFRDGVQAPKTGSAVSRDGGLTWTAEAGREPLVTMSME